MSMEYSVKGWEPGRRGGWNLISRKDKAYRLFRMWKKLLGMRSRGFEKTQDYGGRAGENLTQPN